MSLSRTIMRKFLGLSLLFGLGLVRISAAVRADDAEDKAVAAITKLGGTVTRDDKAAGRPVVAVDFTDAPVRADEGQKKVTDAGLKELKELKSLRTLDLNVTQITDAGLKELAGFQRLQTLYLGGTRVTNAGLKELAGLKSLRTLGISGQKLTPRGVQAARPKVTLSY